MDSIQQATAALMKLSAAGFIGRAQASLVKELMAGEEGEYFIGVIGQLSATIEAMPKTYQTNGQGMEALAHLHYFTGGCDWYISEKDMVPVSQSQAFGLASLGYEPELGYISLYEITDAGAEIDFHWTPKTLAAVIASTKEKAKC